MNSSVNISMNSSVNSSMNSSMNSSVTRLYSVVYWTVSNSGGQESAARGLLELFWFFIYL